MKRRFLAGLLSFAMVFSMIPSTTVLAEENLTNDSQIEMQTEDQEKTSVGNETQADNQEKISVESETKENNQGNDSISGTVRSLQKRISLLPSIEEVKLVDRERQNEIYNEAQAISDVYDALAEEEQKQIDISKLEKLFEYFNNNVTNSSEENPIEVPEAAYIFDNGVIKGISKSWLSTVSADGEMCYLRLVIPAEINGKAVTEIESYSLQYKNNGFQDKNSVDLSKIKIVTVDFSKATNLEKISDFAFDQRSELGGKIDLSRTKVTVIGAGAFRETAITDVILSDNLEKLGDVNTGAGSFAACYQLKSLKYASYTGNRQVAFPKTLTTIGKQCFRYSFLKGMRFAADIPASVSSIGTEAFNTNNNDGSSRFSTIYIKRTKDYSGYDRYAFQNGKSFIIFPGGTSYKEALTYISNSSTYKPTYEVDVVFKEREKEEIVATQKKMYNQAFYYEKNAEDVWIDNDNYKLPEITGIELKPGYEIAWYFEKNEETVTSDSKVNDGSTLPSTMNILTDGITISEPQVKVSGPESVCEGSDITLKAEITNKEEGLRYEYVWAKYDSKSNDWIDIEGENNDTFQVTEGNEYYLAAVTAVDDEGHESEQGGDYVWVSKTRHNWNYGSKDNQITVKCTNSGCKYESEGVTSILTAENMEYTGNEYDKASFGMEVTNLTGAAGSDIQYYEEDSDIPLESAPVDVGKYKAQVTINDETAVTDFEILKARINLSVTLNGWIYGEKANTPSVSGNTENADVAYTYYIDKNCTIKTTAKDGAESDGAIPMNAGNYYVKASVAETDNYAAVEATTSFTIKKKAVTATVRAESKVYDGTTDAKVTATVETGVKGESFMISGLKGTFEDKNVGSEKTVTVDTSHANATAGANTVVTNYTVSYPQTTEADITPCPVELNWSETELTYTGTEQNVTATVKNAAKGDSFAITYEDNTETEVNDNYTAKVTALGNDNYTLENATGISQKWSISYLAAGEAELVGTKGNNDWYVSAVTLVPEEGYRISADKKEWCDFLSYDAQGAREATYYLREIKTGYITDVKTASFKIDTVAPAGEITIGTNMFKEFLNYITFGHWFKDTVSIKIAGEDATSGIDTIEYQKVGKNDKYDVNGNWVEGKSFSITDKDKYVIYARLKDKAGKQTIINSDGIVVFTDSTAVKAINYTKTTKESVDAEVALNGNTVASVKNGGAVLVEGTDYTVSADKITFSGDYLDTLSAGTHTLTVSYNPKGVTEYIDGDKPAESQITVNVSRQTASLEITDALDKEYNGIPADVKYVTNSNAEVKVEYRVDGKWQAEAPTHAGSYEVRASVPENGDYTAASDSKTFTISKTDARMATMTSGVSIYGDAVNITATVSLVNGEIYTGEIEYSYRLAGTDDEYTAGIPSKAGSYETKATVKAFGDYNGASAEGTWTIKRKEVTVSDITAKDKVYDGKAAAELDYSQAAFEGILANDTLTVSATGTFADSNVASEKSVMITDLTLGGKDAGNYVLAGAGQQTITTAAITPKEVSVEITSNGGTYEGTITGATADLSGAVAGENPEVVLTYTGTANDGTVVSGTEVPTHAGTYTVTATVPDTNYSLKAEGATAEFTVVKAAPQLSVSAVADKSYGDSEFKIAASAEDAETAINFVSDNEGTAKVSADGTVTIGNVGTAKITVSMDESSNYLAVAKDVTVTVVPKKVTVTPDKISKVYGDQDRELTYKADGLVGEDTLTDITLSRAEGENVGNYTITAAQKDGANPNYEVTFNEGTFVIEPKNIGTAEVTLGDALKYTGKEQTQEITKVIVDGIEVSADSYEVTGNTETEAGVHTLTITAKEGSNFTGTITWTYVIAPTKPEQIKENADSKVEIGNGTLTIVVKSEGNAPKTSLVTSKAEIIDMLVKSGEITADELAQIANGASVDIVLIVKDASETVSEESKAAMTDTASKAGYTIGQYIDISMYKYMTVNGVTDDGVQIHNTADKIKITVQIPEKLINKDSKVERTYYIIRYHDGKAEIIEGTYDEKAQTFTFETDKFSDYAIAYKDTKKAELSGKTETKAETGSKTAKKAGSDKTKKAVKTGDTTNVYGYFIGFVGAFAVILGMLVLRRKKRR